MKSDPVLDRLLDLHPKSIDLSLGRVQGLLDRLGNPEGKLPPVVHVAGTNGKGSVVAFLRAMLEAAGYRVHVYTSPHLVHFCERIRLAGTLIDDEALTGLLEECEAANQGDPITFFEITTAAAFLAFSRTPADIVLLETGLGGRLDATNVVAAPLLTCITPVSEDHQSFLGDDIADITGEKAGILKADVPTVIAAQGTRKGAGVLAKRAKELAAPTFSEGRDWHVRKAQGGMMFEVKEKTGRSFPAPALTGRHQVQNAGLAMACLEKLDGFHVPDDAIERGLETVDWPARLQRLTSGPLVALLGEGWELWLDGGHNPAAAAVIAQQARAWKGQGQTMALHMVLGMLNSKDVDGYLKTAAPRLSSLHAITIPGEENALDADVIAGTGSALGLASHTAPDVSAALVAIMAADGAPGRILIAGSLYLAGHVLAENKH